MIKRTINYQDQFTNEPRSMVAYFNVSYPELVRLEARFGGYQAYLQKLVEKEDKSELLLHVLELVGIGYGIKVDSSGDFVKSEEITKVFVNSPAYEMLCMELSTNENELLDFMNNVVSQQARELFAKLNATTTTLPPPTTDN